MLKGKKNFSVSANWDPEAQVWVAVSADIPGLVAEARSLQELVVKLQVLIPELCELNKHLMNSPLDTISISADYNRFEQEIQAS